MGPEYLLLCSLACNLSLSWAMQTKNATFKHVQLNFILMIPSHLWCDLVIGIYPSGYPTKILNMFISHKLAKCPARIIFLNLIILKIFEKKYKFWVPNYAFYTQDENEDGSGNVVFSLSQPTRLVAQGEFVMLKMWSSLYMRE